MTTLIDCNKRVDVKSCARSYGLSINKNRSISNFGFLSLSLFISKSNGIIFLLAMEITNR